MGQETKCTAHISGRRLPGRLQLETDKLTFRSGDTRLDLLTNEIAGAQAVRGQLVIRVKCRQRAYKFDLGDAAPRWADRIANPKSLIQKLGVKPENSVSYIGQVDADLLAELKTAKATIVIGRNKSDHDWIFIGAEKSSDLKLLVGVEAKIKPKGGVWVIFPKGLPDLRAQEVIAAGKSTGLVDTKVARISERLTGMKLVIPVSRRK
jgi:hypothetical protein